MSCVLPSGKESLTRSATIGPPQGQYGIHCENNHMDHGSQITKIGAPRTHVALYSGYKGKMMKLSFLDMLKVCFINMK